MNFEKTLYDKKIRIRDVKGSELFKYLKQL